MSGFSNRKTVSEMDVRDTSTSKLMRYGTIQETWDGKRYRYGAAGAVTLAPGKMNIAPASVANHTNRAVDVARAIGAVKISATLGATAAAASAYADGKVVVNDATGEGIEYGIVDHAAVLASGILTAKLDDQVKVALVAATSEVSFVANPWFGAIVNPGAVAHKAIGVNNVSIVAASTGFFQVRGRCAVLSDGIITKGAGVIMSDAVAGALEIEAATTVGGRVGTSPDVTVDTEYPLFDLTIE